MLENVPSSPVHGPASRKMKRPPTITPKRFTRFFTPRQTTHGLRPTGKSGRQLRDITQNAVNRRRRDKTSRNEKATKSDDEIAQAPQESRKRRKLIASPESSPLRSSPSKHANAVLPCLAIFEDEAAEYSDDVDRIDCHKTVFDEAKPFVQPIRRMRESHASSRLLLRSFGGSWGVRRGTLRDHCSGQYSCTSI